MKLRISLFIISIAGFGALHASDDTMQPSYGIKAVKKFASFAFNGADKQELNNVANKYGIKNAHFDPQFKQWTIAIGPNCYKATCGVDTLNIVDYRMGDGNGFEAQVKALKEGRVYEFYSDETVQRKKMIARDKYKKTLQDALSKIKASNGINKKSKLVIRREGGKFVSSWIDC